MNAAKRPRILESYMVALKEIEVLTSLLLREFLPH